jgi:hypothetical protein
MFILVAYNPTCDNWCQKLTDFNKGSMESQQIVELLLSMQAKMDANIKVYHEEMMAMVDAYHERMMACLRKTEADTEKTEHDPGMMQSVEEHQESSKEETTLMPVRGLRKRCRDRNLAAGRRQKPKRRIQVSCESRSRLTIAGKMTTHCATVAWRKRNIFRKTGTQRICGPQKRLTAARINMTCHARVAWRRENFIRKVCTRAKDERVTQRVGLLRKNLWMYHEGKYGTKDLCGGQPLYLRKERTTTNGIEGWSSGQQSHVESGVRLK